MGPHCLCPHYIQTLWTILTLWVCIWFYNVILGSRLTWITFNVVHTYGYFRFRAYSWENIIDTYSNIRFALKIPGYLARCHRPFWLMPSHHPSVSETYKLGYRFTNSDELNQHQVFTKKKLSVITHLCLNFNGGLVKPSLKLKQAILLECLETN